MSMRKVMETGCVTRAARHPAKPGGRFARRAAGRRGQADDRRACVARCDERASRYPNVDAGLAQTAIHGIFFRARLSSIKSRAIFDEFLHDMIAC
ncbi:hypothetical protein ACGYTU_08380 [Burkholderia pseudomallei]